MSTVWDEKIKLREDLEEYCLKDLLQYYDDMIKGLSDDLVKQEEKFDSAIRLLHRRFRDHTHDKQGKTTIPYE